MRYRQGSLAGSCSLRGFPAMRTTPQIQPPSWSGVAGRSCCPPFGVRLDAESFQLLWIVAHHREDEPLVMLHEGNSVARSHRLHSVASTRRPLLNVRTCLVEGDQVGANVHEVSLPCCALRTHVSCSFSRSSGFRPACSSERLEETLHRCVTMCCVLLPQREADVIIPANICLYLQEPARWEEQLP